MAAALKLAGIEPSLRAADIPNGCQQERGSRQTRDGNARSHLARNSSAAIGSCSGSVMPARMHMMANEASVSASCDGFSANGIASKSTCGGTGCAA